MKTVVNEFNIAEEAVQTGVTLGLMRALKHKDIGSVEEFYNFLESDAFTIAVSTEVMNSLCEHFIFEQREV